MGPFDRRARRLSPSGVHAQSQREDAILLRYNLAPSMRGDDTGRPAAPICHRDQRLAELNVPNSRGTGAS